MGKGQKQCVQVPGRGAGGASLSVLRPRPARPPQHRRARDGPGDSSPRAEKEPHTEGPLWSCFSWLLTASMPLLTGHGSRGSGREAEGQAGRGGEHFSTYKWLFDLYKFYCTFEPGLPHCDSYFQEPRGIQFTGLV